MKQVEFSGRATVTFVTPRRRKDGPEYPLARRASDMIEGVPGYPVAYWVPATNEPVACRFARTSSGKAVMLVPEGEDGPDCDLTTRSGSERIDSHFRLSVGEIVDGANETRWTKCPLTGAQTMVHGEIPADGMMFFHPGRFLTWHANSTEVSEHDIKVWEGADEEAEVEGIQPWMLLGFVEEGAITVSDVLEAFEAKLGQTAENLFGLQLALDTNKISQGDHDRQRREIMSYRACLAMARDFALEALPERNSDEPIALAPSTATTVVAELNTLDPAVFAEAVERALAKVTVTKPKPAASRKASGKSRAPKKAEGADIVIADVIAISTLTDEEKPQVAVALESAGISTAAELFSIGENGLKTTPMILISGKMGTIGQKRASKLLTAARKLASSPEKRAGTN